MWAEYQLCLLQLFAKHLVCCNVIYRIIDFYYLSLCLPCSLSDHCARRISWIGLELMGLIDLITLSEISGFHIK